MRPVQIGLVVLIALVPCVAALSCGSKGSSGGASAGGQDAGGAQDSGASGADAGADAATGSDAAAPLDPNGNPPTACASPGGNSSNPPADYELSGALDTTAAHFVVFGGDTSVPVCGPPPSHQFIGDTYVLDVGCASWTKVASSGPSPRGRHVTALDPAANRAILFGGRYSTGGESFTTYDDVWAFDFASSVWTQVQTTGTAPSGRANSAAIVDATKNRLVVFGGDTSKNGNVLSPAGDTWALDLGSGAWTQIATSGTNPPAREFHEMAVDPVGHVAYVFAGANANAFTGSFFSDVWALDLVKDAWSEVATTGTGPGGRIEGALVYDTVAKRLVAFAGHDDGAIGNENDLFVLDVTQSPAAWSKLAPGDTPGKPPTGQCSFPPDFTNVDKNAPERRNGFAYGPRADGRAFVVFGGGGDCGLMADSWWWADGAQAWTNTQPSPVGLSCERVQTSCTSLCN